MACALLPTLWSVGWFSFFFLRSAFWNLVVFGVHGHLEVAASNHSLLSASRSNKSPAPSLSELSTASRIHCHHACEREAGFRRQLSERFESRPVLLFVQQSRCRIAMPAVAMFQHGNQFGGRRFAGHQSRSHCRQTVGVGSPRSGDRSYGFVVDDVQVAIGRVSELNGPKRVVGQGEEFGLGIGATGDETYAAGFQLRAKHKVVRRLTNKNAATIFRRPGVAPINRHARHLNLESTIRPRGRQRVRQQEQESIKDA